MNNFITINQFLEQPTKIQETFEKWSIGRSGLYFTDNNKKVSYGVNTFDTPAFTETQLRAFIQKNCSSIIKNIEIHDDNTCYVTLDSGRCFVAHNKDLLQAYWEIACRVARECE